MTSSEQALMTRQLIDSINRLTEGEEQCIYCKTQIKPENVEGYIKKAKGYVCCGCKKQYQKDLKNELV